MPERSRVRCGNPLLLQFFGAVLDACLGLWRAFSEVLFLQPMGLRQSVRPFWQVESGLLFGLGLGLGLGLGGLVFGLVGSLVGGPLAPGGHLTSAGTFSSLLARWLALARRLRSWFGSLLLLLLAIQSLLVEEHLWTLNGGAWE